MLLFLFHVAISTVTRLRLINVLFFLFRFGLDLSKIQEGSIETAANIYEEPMDSEDENLEFKTPSIEMADSPFLDNAKNIFLQNVAIR